MESNISDFLSSSNFEIKVLFDIALELHTYMYHMLLTYIAEIYLIII